MFSIEEFIIVVFCCVDDLWQELTQGQPIRRGGFAPALSDPEVITMAIVAEFLGICLQKQIWQYFRRHWRMLFPTLKSRSTFSRQAANLSSYKQELQRYLATKMGAFEDDVHIVDGIPITLCCYTYASRCRSFRGEAAFSYCAAKDESYYGFKGLLNLTASGIITGFTLTPANVDERDSLWDIVDGVQGLRIGDKGFIRQPLSKELAEKGIDLQTALRSNMKDTRPNSLIRLLQTVRRLVETVNAQLAERFNFEQTKARDMWHLMSRLSSKLLAHTVCCWIQRLHGVQDMLQFDHLVTE